MLWNQGPISFFCTWKSNCPRIIHWKNYFLPLNGIDTLLKNQMTIDICIYFWTSNSIPLVYMSTPMPFPNYFDYCIFVVKFFVVLKLGKDPSTFILLYFLNNFLACNPIWIWGLAFPFIQKILLEFDRVALNL